MTLTPLRTREKATISKRGWRSQIDGSQATHPYLQENCTLVAESRKIWDEKSKLERLVPAIEILHA